MSLHVTHKQSSYRLTTSTRFPVRNYLKQGAVLLPLLVNFASEFVMLVASNGFDLSQTSTTDFFAIQVRS
jgi:hypothetical protein